MELRLLFRTGTEDYDGRLAGYTYSTTIVNIPDNAITNKSGHVIPPEVIGGEWLKAESEVKP